MPGDTCVTGHSVVITDRGGTHRIGQLARVNEVQWSRERDAVSEARVKIAARHCSEQSVLLDRMRRGAGRYEVAIWRGSDRVWEGPIREVESTSEGLQITAQDVAAYLFGTPLTVDWPNHHGGGPVYMTERVQEIILYELTNNYTMTTNAGDVTVPRWETIPIPANILPFLDIRPSVGPQGIRTLSETVAFEMMLGEHLDNLAEGGLDYTVIGRRIVIWDGGQELGRTRALSEGDFFGDIRVVTSGSDQASIGHISAQRTEDGGGVGNAGGPDDFFGVWTRLATLASEEGSDAPTQIELNSQARRLIAGRQQAPMRIVAPDGIRLSHDLRLRELVPGVTVPVEAGLNLIPVRQSMRLDRLSVTETPEGENVQVTLSPIADVEGIA